MNLVTEYETYKDVYLQINKYVADGSLAIDLWNEEYGPIATLTVCLRDIFLAEDEAYVDTNNCPWAPEFIERENLGEKTGRMRGSGYCVYPAYKFNMDRLHSLEMVKGN